MKHINTWTLFSQVVAVAARKLENAQDFAQKHNILRVYGSYEELARDPDIGESVLFFCLFNHKQSPEFYFDSKLSLCVPMMWCRNCSAVLHICADVVYIGVIHPYHLSTSRLFTNAKKNVLCEKPLGMNTKEVREILDCAKRNDVFLMEVGVVLPNTWNSVAICMN